MADIGTVDGLVRGQLLTYTSGVFRAVDGDDNTIYKAVQRIRLSLDETNLDEDYIDTGIPIYSRIGDKKGTFEFDLRATVDLFETDSDDSNNEIHATDNTLASKWLNDLQNEDPPIITFVETLDAKAEAKFVRIRARLRIKAVDAERDPNKGTLGLMVRGEILKIQRAAQEAKTSE